MLTYSIRYLLPHRQVRTNLNRIAERLRDLDFVALQETDAGSFRNYHIHQAQYIAMRAHIPYCYTLVTRGISRLATISLALLSRFPCVRLIRHRLPASRHGRGLMEAVFCVDGREIAVFVTHLSLRRTSRIRQMRFVIQRLKRYPYAILMGDLNCEPGAGEFNFLIQHGGLTAVDTPPTFPSWKPRRCLDHILVTRGLRLQELHTMPFVCSDHLPVKAVVTASKEKAPA